MPLLLARLISRTRLSWFKFAALLGLLLVFLAIGAVYLDGTLGEFFSAGHWRILFYPALITYMLVIVPPLLDSGDVAMLALRPLVDMDDDAFARLLDESASVSPRGEVIAFGVGIGIGIMSWSPWVPGGTFSWAAAYLWLAQPLEMGLLAWCIYVAFAGTKPIAILHDHLKEVDILDVGRFEPIGRQSLLSSLAFIGGAAINAFFQLGSESLFSSSSLIAYGVLTAIAALIFFLSMRQAHRVMAAAKDRELRRVQDNIIDAYRSLEGIPVGSPDIGSISAKVDLWQAYERRLKGVRTWPYDLGMLRTLTLSVFAPVAINLLQRVVAELLG